LAICAISLTDNKIVAVVVVVVAEDDGSFVTAIAVVVAAAAAVVLSKLRKNGSKTCTQYSLANDTHGIDICSATDLASLYSRLDILQKLFVFLLLLLLPLSLLLLLLLILLFLVLLLFVLLFVLDMLLAAPSNVSLSLVVG
jgi:hypothetical protein